MIAALFASVLLQVVSQESFVAEGEVIGRAAATLGFCGGLGYEIDQAAAEQWAVDFSVRALAAGWSDFDVSGSIQAGYEAQMAEIGQVGLAPGLTDAEFATEVTSFVQGMKGRCRILQVEAPDLIRDIDGGEQRADAWLDDLLRPAPE